MEKGWRVRRVGGSNLGAEQDSTGAANTKAALICFHLPT